MHTTYRASRLDARGIAHKLTVNHALELLMRGKPHRVDQGQAAAEHGAATGADAADATGCARGDAAGHREGGSAQA